MATRVGQEHPVAGAGQQRHHLGEAVDVVRPAVQQEHHRPVRRAGIDETDIEYASLDLPHISKQRPHPRPLNGTPPRHRT
ncbi:hypothetical protein Vse01_28630 [Micromonospora sediminimaris]|uniref:Uncharacterized protein n=1 Tax=Micromonospora sediminimaris TaxID=547162 RepID=A0A9W5USA5_9ACTN|nr:hypothetical protein Vse01_28630 [Micromonospora sediminimaris]